eukprot:141322_1
MPSCQDFVWLQSPDANDNTLQKIEGFTITSDNTGFTSECTDSANVDAFCVDDAFLAELSIDFYVSSGVSSEHGAKLYMNNKVYECAFTPSTAGTQRCSTNCAGA